jgi:predicted ribosome quality control (RQC) complex YloA/Tae2 family protein
MSVPARYNNYSMNIDGLTVAALAAELSQSLPGSRIQGIYHPQPTLITLELWAGEEKRLLIETGESARAHLTRQEFTHPEQPSAFCMLLRKYLRNGVIVSITQPGLERILDLYIIRHGEEYVLRAELLGKQTNIVLLQGEKILGALKPTVGQRSFRSGATYQAPPSQGKLDPRSMTQEEFFARLVPSPLDLSPSKGRGAGDGSEDTSHALLKIVDGLGPRLAKELALRALLDPVQPVASLTAEQRLALWTAVHELFEIVHTKRVYPCVYVRDEKPFDVAPVALKLYADLRCESRSTLSEAFDECTHAITQESRFAQEQRQLQGLISQRCTHVRKALERVRADLARAQNYELIKHEGDLLMANLPKLHRGLREIELEDFLDGTTRIVRLDPALEPIENAQQKFERYKKLKRAREKLEARLGELRQELEYFEGVERHLQHAESEADLDGIRKELCAGGYLPRERREQQIERTSGPREFVVRGYRVWVGRSSTQNDELVRHAAREDYWLHARDRPGSHVIVKNPQQRELPPDVLHQAAQLAAYYSKGRGAAKVPVSYTRIKYLRKGARPGLVLMTQEEGTLLVVPKGDSS